mmetsp:Transcript_41197/g.87758  ORF Transcript_41197/g.87758 Transcript_41197/m.87758 type:complete len:291 (+) Transcript_41197:185-1057(+)
MARLTIVAVCVGVLDVLLKVLQDVLRHIHVLRAPHQQLGKATGGGLVILLLLHGLEAHVDLLEVHPQQTLLQQLQDCEGHRKDRRQAVAHDHVPNDQHHREREDVDEEGKEPLVQVDRGLHILLEEVIPQLRQHLRQELVACLDVLPQERHSLPVETIEADMVHEAHKHAEHLFLVPLRGEDEKSGYEVHALTIPDRGTVVGVGVEDAKERLLPLLVKLWQLGKSPPYVQADEFAILGLDPAEGGIILRSLLLVELQGRLPDLPAHLAGKAAARAPTEFRWVQALEHGET